MENDEDREEPDFVDLMADVHGKIAELFPGPVGKKAERLPGDLSDAYHLFVNLKSLIEHLMSLDRFTDRRQVLAVIKDILSELDIHLGYHRKPLIKGLEYMADRIRDELKSNPRRSREDA